ncbi:uncharacterized protein B0H18DRAFT_1038775 [Fomitopsis serialis]|uniref:uncharacterized protein n=1 Tax=Fomitopsis serialis TaxID=139415 RepID=UPI00200738A8|nr:uncharacterized protein B0H18DRAFT_1038775 [Neoantrodia serialis]KAH9916198.1 hypothetical protein B0H18DRAFT_1038775 [Neoantrodia serialis]
MPSAPTQLPLELCEAVIDCLHDNRGCLRICSLICRSWSPRARRHLFRKVQLLRRRQGLRFLAALESSWEAGTRIGEYVLDLELPRMGLTGKHRDLLLRCALLVEISRHLPNLECLRMYDFDWNGLIFLMESAGLVDSASEIPDRSRTANAPATESESASASSPSMLFPRLTSLRISSSASSLIASGEAVVQFFKSFPELNALDIAFMPTLEASRSVHPPDRIIARDSGGAPCVRLRELRLDTSTWAASPALDWLSRPSVELDLHKLDIDLFHTWGATSRLAELLGGRECAMLEHLAFSLSDVRVLPLLDLSKYRFLRSLHMRSYYHFKYIAQVFRDMHEEDAGDPVDWEALNHALVSLSRRCPGLSITFDCRFDLVPPADNFIRYTVRWMKDRLAPTLAARHLDAKLVVNGVRYH